ncbi:hypothetical protein QBC35DRAFT_67939 [Podospora australis]|uniref:Uncharacterized protein n=1 Tax=Podospora australis TaxID=1536484 RepID=A0AAN6WLE9_9PEZI|nr:hypothetical protein QBC35DRAFT_67939 [Podospora australis]
MHHSDEERLRLLRRTNARLITLSDQIPTMSLEEERPYCIWFPGLANESTYRELFHRYPEMKYQIGRACAVGGFVDLYHELDLLPEVSIAEEARESSSPESDAIYQHIISQPTRYSILNDYTRTVNATSPRPGASLNGDTAIRPPLSYLYGTRQLDEEAEGKIWPPYFNLTEYQIDDSSSSFIDNRNPYPYPSVALPKEFTHLFYTPLPFDLPTVKKDSLIVMAAYEGNVDRYVRLRRPGIFVPEERAAVIHGIYHCTTFAKYFSILLDSDENDLPYSDRINKAITARFIMLNEPLSRIPEDPNDCPRYREDNDLPHLIWEPLLPQEETLRELILRRPNNIFLRESVALACIKGNYRATWDALEFPAEILLDSLRLWQQALKYKSISPYYAQDLRKRAISLAAERKEGKDEDEDFKWWETKEEYTTYTEWHIAERRELYPTTALVPSIQSGSGIAERLLQFPTDEEGWEVEANGAGWELYILTDEATRDKVEEQEDGAEKCLQYEGWKLFEDWVSADQPEKPWVEKLPWGVTEGYLERKKGWGKRG